MVEYNIPEDEKLKELIHDAPSEENDNQLEKKVFEKQFFFRFFYPTQKRYAPVCYGNLNSDG